MKKAHIHVNVHLYIYTVHTYMYTVHEDTYRFSGNTSLSHCFRTFLSPIACLFNTGYERMLSLIRYVEKTLASCK